MKIIALGDTHGRDNWKHISASGTFDKMVFIGDYFDSHEGVSTGVQISNFMEIIEFKKRLGEKVVLLLGNHDYHYLDPTYEKYTAFQEDAYDAISALLTRALDEGLMQMAYVWKQILFTHAGVTKTWSRAENIDPENLEYSLNTLFISDPEAYMFTGGIYGSPSGDDITQTPIWVRPRSLLEDKLDSYIQVVGHTVHQQLTIIEGVAFIDCLGTSGEYLVVEDGILRAGSMGGQV